MELLLLLTFCGLFVGVPAIIYKSAKTLTIKENENYSRLKETLEKQQVDRVWEAFKRSGVVPLPSGFAGIENVSLFNDQNQSLIFAFQFENHLARKESRIPKTYKKLEEIFLSSEENVKGWSLVSSSEGEDFLERLADLDDALDFTVSKEDLELTHKIAFNLKLPVFTADKWIFERVIKIDDGRIKVLNDNENSNGTLSVCIKVKDFSKNYKMPAAIEIAKRNFEIT